MLSSMPSEPRKATDSDLLKAIGDAIMRARESHPDDLSQQDVADRAGIDRVQYNRYELGKVMPGWDKILKIAAVLEVDPGALIPGQIMSFQPCSGKTTSLIISRLPLFMQQPGRRGEEMAQEARRTAEEERLVNSTTKLLKTAGVRLKTAGVHAQKCANKNKNTGAHRLT